LIALLRMRVKWSVKIQNTVLQLVRYSTLYSICTFFVWQSGVIFFSNRVVASGMMSFPDSSSESVLLSGSMPAMRQAASPLTTDCQNWRRAESTHVQHQMGHEEDRNLLTEVEEEDADDSLLTTDRTLYRTARTSDTLDEFETERTPVMSSYHTAASTLFSAKRSRRRTMLRTEFLPGAMLAADSDEESKDEPTLRPPSSEPIPAVDAVLRLPSSEDESDFEDDGKRVRSWLANSPEEPERGPFRNLSSFQVSVVSCQNSTTSSSSLMSELTSVFSHVLPEITASSERTSKPDATHSDATSSEGEGSDESVEILEVVVPIKEMGSDVSVQVSLSNSDGEQGELEDGDSDGERSFREQRDDASLQVSMNSVQGEQERRESQGECRDGNHRDDASLQVSLNESSSVQEEEQDNHEDDSDADDDDDGQRKRRVEAESKVRGRQVSGESSSGDEALEMFLSRQKQLRLERAKTSPEKSRQPMDDFIVDDDDSDAINEVDSSDESLQESQTTIRESSSDEDDKKHLPDLSSSSSTYSSERVKTPSPPRPVVKRKPMATLVANTPKPSQTKTFSLLASLALEQVDDRCHPTAVKYITRYTKHREELAQILFRLFNEEIFHEALDPQTPLVWSSRLLTTAGTCVQKATYEGGVQKRTSAINLSMKVLDSADRLRDTLIHEMCHAAAWVVTGYRDGHGPIWKDWAKR